MKKQGISFRRQTLIPLLIGGALAAIGYTNFGENLESKMFDIFLNIKPAVKEDPRIVLLDIDEPSIVRTTSWPWPRGLVGRGLETLAEIGAQYVVFDIEYLQQSPKSINRDFLERGLASEFNLAFEEISSNVGFLFNSLGSGQIPLSDAGEYGDMLVELIDESRDDLYKKTQAVAMENDSYLGKAMALFGKAFVTINAQDGRGDYISEELRGLTEKKFAYPRVQDNRHKKPHFIDYLIPIMEVSSRAAGAGFTNVEIDSDGVRRRISLVHNINDKYYLQLAFSPLIDSMDRPEIILNPHNIRILDANIDGIKQDIHIPLDKHGQMLLRWPKKSYYQSFSHTSFFRLLEYRDNEDLLIENLRLLASQEAWLLFDGPNPLQGPLAHWSLQENQLHIALESGKPEDRAAWLASKAAFKESVADFLQENWQNHIQKLIFAARDADEDQDPELYNALNTRFASIYTNCLNIQNTVKTQEDLLRQGLDGKTCIVGWTATATTDIGANPFDEKYINVGTHATVLNTIYQNDFLSEAPQWSAIVLNILLSFGIIFLIAKLKTRLQMLVGASSTLIVLVACYLAFHFSGFYLPALNITVAVFLSFITYTIATFIVAEREKNFLRKAWSTYLSPDVINQIMDNPAMLRLGGEKKWITAIFTDVKGFSTISEKLDPEDLVSLLNIYLSAMSDLIMENKGTIDKFEGDAIISFFGAPITLADHARLACYASVRMKQKEAELNKQFLADKATPFPLLTRIGINTGDMVVGNMGTQQKMDYTIMGNAVNLAARLEGVNKQYGSWILISDMTKQEAGNEFLYRRFDPVRVVGINTPVQLWEVLGLVSETDDQTLDYLDRFAQAHQVFDSRDWKKAGKLFLKLHEERPEDGPSLTYLNRCKKFIATPPEPNWDGVFSLTEK